MNAGRLVRGLRHRLAERAGVTATDVAGGWSGAAGGGRRHGQDPGRRSWWRGRERSRPTWRSGSRVARWALPGELAGEPPGRRTVRDWLVDVALLGLAVWWWLRELDNTVSPDAAYVEVMPGWMLTIDPWIGAVGCLALWFRRRFPLGLALALVPGLTLSGTVFGAVLVSIFTVAIHRGWLWAVLITAVQMAQALSFVLYYQPEGMSTAEFATIMSLMLVIPLVCGLMVRFRRQLIMSLRRDAEREHQRRLLDARRAERERLAREMHDVLAHRISLLSVHAGALAYRTAQSEGGRGSPLAAEEVAAAVRVIRDSAHQALTELGEVLAVLRTDEPDDGRAAPLPLLTDLPRLVDEARSAGQAVAMDLDGVGSAAPPPRAQEQRTAYRVVQEGLTNARKHAPDAPVVVRVAGAPGAGLDVTVTNPLPEGTAGAEIPGAGAGLTGLAERVALDGGTLDHGPTDGAFQLAAHLPWRR
jgi:signal transduction histidine kinase